MSQIEIGRLLRASTIGCVVGCRVTQIDVPSFGGMVRIPISEDDSYQVFGLIYDIHIDDDGLVRQLITADNVSPGVILDNRMNRNVPVEISVLFMGYEQAGFVSHLLPPRPPLTLDVIYSCTSSDLVRFSSPGFGYFRHILRNVDLPAGELLAAHILQEVKAHSEVGDLNWSRSAAEELITLLRDDYTTLMAVLSALAETQLRF